MKRNSQPQQKQNSNLRFRGNLRASLTPRKHFRNEKSPKKSLMRVFQSVNEIEEEGHKNDTDDDNSQIGESVTYSQFKKGKSKVKGILALTKDNLRKLDLKNQVRYYASNHIASHIQRYADGRAYEQY